MTSQRRPVPTDPRIRALIAQAVRSRGRSTDLGRRSFLLGAAGTVGAGALLAACGTGASRSRRTPRRTRPTRTSWCAGPTGPQYLDQNDDGTEYPTLAAFEEASGIQVTYAEDIEDNDAFYGKVSGQLKNGQDIGYDIVTLTDWMAARMIRLGYTQELDRRRCRTRTTSCPTLADVDFDPAARTR